MRIGCGTAIAPRKAHIAGCKGTAVCADTQCLSRHCVSVVVNGTREHLWIGLDSLQPWRAAWRRPRQPAPPPMPTRPPPPTRLLRAPQRRGLVPKRHARRQAGRSCGSARYCAMQSDIPCVRARPAAARRQAAAPMPVGAVRVLRWLPRPILSVRRKHAQDDLGLSLRAALGRRPAGLKAGGTRLSRA